MDCGLCGQRDADVDEADEREAKREVNNCFSCRCCCSCYLVELVAEFIGVAIGALVVAAAEVLGVWPETCGGGSERSLPLN